VAGRIKRALGDVFGLRNFGVNLTTLQSGASTALHHRHSRQDEFVYVVHGFPTLFTDSGAVRLRPGMCAGFPAGGTAHHLVNEGPEDAVILEIGDRSPNDTDEYPDDDLVATRAGEHGASNTRMDGPTTSAALSRMRAS
jgi:uncharacterized cupin superfamily protein